MPEPEPGAGAESSFRLQPKVSAPSGSARQRWVLVLSAIYVSIVRGFYDVF